MLYRNRHRIIFQPYVFRSLASVLETLLTAQTRLVLPTAIHTEDRRERSTQADRHENIDARKLRLEHRKLT